MSAPPDDALVLRAPFPGVFHRRPSPDEAPYVEVGSQVSAGDVTGLIEIMKNFYELLAPIDGFLDEVITEDGATVSVHQELLRFRPKQGSNSLEGGRDEQVG